MKHNEGKYTYLKFTCKSCLLFLLSSYRDLELKNLTNLYIVLI